tara:strand:- start:349 stop:1551 length:1203 start_codon:yes stop_codon:yes gene_type:complete
MKLSQKVRDKLIYLRLKKNNVKVVKPSDNNKRTLFHYKNWSIDSDFLQFYNLNTFQNQKNFGENIFKSFMNLNLLTVFAVAPTQSGKTGSMLSTIQHFYNSPHHHVPLNNIFIFTTHSSREWLIQTKQRFPKKFENNIFHRNQIKTFIRNIRGKKNCLIIFDESHIASSQFQTMFRIYNALGFYDSKHMFDNNIKIVHFTATPKNIIHDAHAYWGNSFITLNMNVPDSYVSLQNYMDNNQILQAKDLRTIENVIDFKQYVSEDKPGYHIIRTSRGKYHLQTIDHFKNVFSSFNNPVFISEPLDKSFNFDVILKIKPKVHTFIFIIDKIRCAKTIHIQFVHNLYERVSDNSEFSTIIQGLAGRATGYHKHVLHIRIFSHIKHISQFIYKTHPINYKRSFVL